MSTTRFVLDRALGLLAMGALITAAGACAARTADRRNDVDRGGMVSSDRSAPAYDSVRSSESSFESSRRTDSGFESERRSSSSFESSSSGFSVRSSPPALRNDEMGTRPSLHHHWIAGYWRPEGGDWTWVPGRWERPPQGSSEWIAPRFEERGETRTYYEGHWR